MNFGGSQDQRQESPFIMHDSFKDLKTRRAEQEIYRKQLEEQIKQRKKAQEQERDGFRNKKSQPNTNRHEQATKSSPKSEHIPTPATFRSHEPTEPNQFSLTNISSPKKSPLHPRPLSATLRGDRKILQTINELDHFNEPHPAALVERQEAELPSMLQPVPRPQTNASDVPSNSMGYMNPAISGIKSPQSNSIPQDQMPTSTKPQEMPPSPDEYNNQAFSSGTSTESSSYEDVIVSKNITTSVPKVHVSQTSEQLAGVKVSRSQYRAELQEQIADRKRREEERQRKEKEAEEKIQEKIRIEQENMQREYEEDLRKQQEKELEAEKKRLATLGKHSEILKAQEKMKQKQRKLANNPPSQREASSMKTVESGSPQSSESNESLESICEFFDETSNASANNKSFGGEIEKYVNPDDRIVPALAKKLREEALQPQPDPTPDDNETPVVQRGESFVISELPELPEVLQSKKSSTSYYKSALQTTFGGSRTARLYTHDSGDSNEPPKPMVTREMAIRSAPCDIDSETTPRGREFLASLKNYLQDEKVKLMERIKARASKSNESF